MAQDPSTPRAVVIRAAGTNCDEELSRAFTLAGASVDLVHLDALVADPARLEAYDLFGFPGGFSYGDDIASGRIFAMRAREKLYPALAAALARGALAIGVCNGFQVLVQIGLLPGPDDGAWPADQAPPRRLALTDNQDATFHARWVGVAYEPASCCVWTRGLHALPEPGHVLPVAHGEGCLVPQSAAILSALESRGQVALRYTDNFNGSAGAVAGVCDVSGRVLGLMPHPERFLDWNRHPSWTRLDPALRRTMTPGLSLFKNAVDAVRQSPQTVH